jgi:hypothetical protein
MSCPRCSGRLERYELRDSVAAACVDCGYADVPVDHVSEPTGVETWTSVVERYSQRGDGPLADRDVGPAPPEIPDEGGDPGPRVVHVPTPDADAGGTPTGEESPAASADADGTDPDSTTAGPAGAPEPEPAPDDTDTDEDSTPPRENGDEVPEAAGAVSLSTNENGERE